MRALIFLAALVFSTPSFAETKIVELTSDKPVYSAGETGILRANFFSAPSNSDFDFDIIGTLNGAPLPSERITDFQIVSAATNLQPGSYTWTVTIVVQDARLARDLKATIQYYSDQVDDLNAQIAVETDPVKLQTLIDKRDEALSLQTAATTNLASIRTPVLAPLSITFTVQ